MGNKIQLTHLYLRVAMLAVVAMFSRGTTIAQQATNPIIAELVNNMVYVAGGTFQMGDWSSGVLNEVPAHNVTLSSFYIGKYEVTQEQWQAVMGSNPSYFKGAKRPVENVSWGDCQVFIRRLNLLTGKKFRLPTEAEWEYAARGGNKSRGYTCSGSNTIGVVAWSLSNSNDKTHEVATKAPNELGIYDMSGNVWEWCEDWYSSSYYSRLRARAVCIAGAAGPKAHFTVARRIGATTPRRVVTTTGVCDLHYMI